MIETIIAGVVAGILFAALWWFAGKYEDYDRDHWGPDQ